jgi:hypothetical protein
MAVGWEARIGVHRWLSEQTKERAWGVVVVAATATSSRHFFRIEHHHHPSCVCMIDDTERSRGVTVTVQTVIISFFETRNSKLESGSRLRDFLGAPTSISSIGQTSLIRRLI